MPTKVRTLRVPDETWEKAQRKAEQEGRALSEVVREFLDEYIEAPAG